MDTLTSFIPPPAFLFKEANSTIYHLIPYVILIFNCVLFRLLRSLADRLLTDQPRKVPSGGSRLFKLFIDELISTCELCADCAELNVVYERHGSLAYGVGLFVLSYLWLDTFGDAHTTPGYLVEDYVFKQGNQLLKSGDAYARFVGQSIAMPLAWRLASFYWKYKLLAEHEKYLETQNCQTSLTTSTINGFLIEFVCCLTCRLTELIGHRLHADNRISQRALSVIISFGGTILVVMALELSGGYFNPVLAASLEYGCRGIHFYQHVVVFWLGPLLGHLYAKGLFMRFGNLIFGYESAGYQRYQGGQVDGSKTSSSMRRKKMLDDYSLSPSSKRLTRSNSQRGQGKQKKH